MVRRRSVRFPGVAAAVSNGGGMAVVAGGTVRGGAGAALPVLRAGSQAAAEPSRRAVADLVRRPGRCDRGRRRGNRDQHHAPGQPRLERRLSQRAGQRGEPQRRRPGRGSAADLRGPRGPGQRAHPRARDLAARSRVLRQHRLCHRGRTGPEGQVRSARALPGRAAAVDGRAEGRPGAFSLTVAGRTPHRSARPPRASGPRARTGPPPGDPGRRPGSPTEPPGRSASGH